MPRVADRLPQLVTPDTLALALRFASEAANPYFRLVYNSLGAYGTVNHLHFQASRVIVVRAYCIIFCWEQ